MKFLAGSDFHGELPSISEWFDLMMITGDICPDMYGVNFSQIDWINNEFIPWVNSLPFLNVWSKVILVPGNHDKCFDGLVSKAQITEWEMKTNGHLKILIHDEYNFEYPVSDGIDSLKIFGTPYCTKFGSWSFMVDDEILWRKYAQIPDDVDILLSHDSPHINKMGAVLDEDSRFYNPNAGNKILAVNVLRINPLIFHSGHIHSGNHEPFFNGNTFFANVSCVNEDLEFVNPILSYTFDEETKKIIL